MKALTLSFAFACLLTLALPSRARAQDNTAPAAGAVGEHSIRLNPDGSTTPITAPGKFQPRTFVEQPDGTFQQISAPGEFQPRTFEKQPDGSFKMITAPGEFQPLTFVKQPNGTFKKITVPGKFQPLDQGAGAVGEHSIRLNPDGTETPITAPGEFQPRTFVSQPDGTFKQINVPGTFQPRTFVEQPDGSFKQIKVKGKGKLQPRAAAEDTGAVGEHSIRLNPDGTETPITAPGEFQPRTFVEQPDGSFKEITVPGKFQPRGAETSTDDGMAPPAKGTDPNMAAETIAAAAAAAAKSGNSVEGGVPAAVKNRGAAPQAPRTGMGQIVDERLNEAKGGDAKAEDR